jgi:hypothetical protein
MKFICFFILFINTILPTTDAQNISTTIILASATDDRRVQHNLQITDFAKTLNYTLPYLKKVEGRIGINGSALRDTIFGGLRNEDYYGISISPNSLLERKQQFAMKEAQVSVYAAENRVLLQQALLERYQLLATIYFGEKLLVERGKLVPILQKKHETVRAMIEQGVDIKIKDVMDTENDRNYLFLALIEIENNLALQLKKTKQFVGTANTNIDFSTIIDIPKIAETVQLLKASGLIENPLLHYKKIQQDFAVAKYNIENAQNRQIFEFAQIGYQHPIAVEVLPKRINISNNFSLRFGVQLPILGNSNKKRAEALLQQREAENSFSTTALLNERAIELQYVKVENLIKQHRACTEKAEQSLFKKLLTNQKLMAQITVLEIVEVQISQLKLEIRCVEIAQDLMNEYIRLLDLTGAMSARPLKNYLRTDLEGW